MIARTEALFAQFMSGDAEVFGPLEDNLYEQGEPMMLEVGKCYMLKTPTIYYLGRVVQCTYAWVELEHVSEVYDTGETNKCWTSGKPTNFENYPHGETVRIPLLMIVAAPSWSKPLLNGGVK